jgi:GPH family glycoside/pentoside/hexuronide:cation symporter
VPKLSKATLFSYSLADLPVAMSIFPVIVFIPRFYSADLGVPLAWVGTILIVQRLFDVVTDPLMGVVSDRTRSRFGRRRPWVAASAPILMLAVYRLFMPPEGAGGGHLLFWGMVLSIGTTMIIIPYYAWGAELSADYHERSRVTGARAMLNVVGSFSAQAVPAMGLLVFGLGGTDFVLTAVGMTMLVLTPLCIGVTVWRTPEPEVEIQSQMPIMSGLKLMVGNRPFLQLVIAFMIGSIGLNITTPLYAFFVADVLGSEDQTIYMLSFFYLSSLFAVPFWVWLAGRIGKHRAYIGAFFLLAFAHPFYLLLGDGDFWRMLPITLATGFAAGGFSQTLPNSMKADVIDLDALESGENRAGLFFAAWSFAQKATATIGAGIAMYGLSLVGYDAALGGGNGTDQLFGLRFLFSTFPSLFFLTGAAIVWKYPITEARHREIRAEIAGRGVAPSMGDEASG